ncbi:nucleotide exchange factor GrpE [Dethiothermospora halolimnae]|uniref:nucleotide exchange factor GrpE n=1 Tax=Dethiothermospora halolimnae TaxID=3114390 RepID=UPI003CCBABFE
MKHDDTEKVDIKDEEKVDSNLDAVKEEMEEEVKDTDKDYKEMYEKMQQELEQLNNRFLRLQADFNNYKRRTEEQKEKIYAYANEELVIKQLEVLDNFERALSAEKESKEGLYQGVEMIYNQLINTLKSIGVEEIKALNEKFDPNLHHGVAREDSEDHEEDIVLEVFQKGYKLKDKVIRPSMVKVSN